MRLADDKRLKLTLVPQKNTFSRGHTKKHQNRGLHYF